MSELLPTIAAAGPVATAWGVHAVWMSRRLGSARRDPLTGLLTRVPFEKRAARLLRTGPCAVAVVDLDGFKAVNDSFGHAAGDAAIRGAGAGLFDATDEGRRGIAARLGGDEFALVVPTSDPVALPWLLRGLHSELCAPFQHEGRTLAVGASVGGCWTGDLPHPTLSAALRRADEAMYVVKRSGGGWLAAGPGAPSAASVNGRRPGRDGTWEVAA